MILISVSEKMPETSKTDLFDKEQNMSDRVLVVEGGRYYFAKYNTKYDFWSVEGITGRINVTYWMPLPDISKLEINHQK